MRRTADLWVWLLSLAVLLPATGVAAEGPRWLPVIADQPDGPALLPVVERFGDALKRHTDVTLVDMGAAADAYASLIVQPTEVSEDEIARVGTQIDQLTTNIGFGKLGAAAEGLSQLLALPDGQRDQSLLRLGKAESLLGLCLTLAAELPTVDSSSHARQAAHCISLLPTAGGHWKLVAPSVPPLYRETLDAMLAQGAASLFVEADSLAAPCTVAINGHERGALPLHEPRLPAVPVRIAVTCDETTRTFAINLSPGENRLHVPYGPTHGVTTDGYLAVDPFVPDGFRVRQATVLTTVLGYEVALVFRRGRAGQVYAMKMGANNERLDSVEFPTTAAPEVIAQVARKLAGVETAVVATDAEPIERPAYFDAPVRRIAGISLAVAGLASGIATWTFYDLRLQYRGEVEVDRPEYHAKYIADGKNALLLASMGATLFTAGAPLFLPDYDDLQALPWIAAGTGLAGVGAGLYLAAIGSTCRRTDCPSGSPDVLAGPLVLIESAALLAIPGTYLVRELLGSSDVRADVAQIHGGGLHVQVSGSF